MTLVILAMLIIAALQVPALISRRQWGELAAFIALWLGASLYAVLVTLDVQIPNLTRIIADVITTYLPLPGFLVPPSP